MEFAAFPPELNSALMYSGAGSGPLIGAATAWQNLAAELTSNAAQYSSVVGGLAGAWLGPSATAMTGAAGRYASWMAQTAAQAEMSASRAMAAATAYEVAFAATVPPPVIAENRAELLMLVSTNIMGQNTPAIMANEALYTGYWAQDIAAMMGYQAASSAATQLTPFQPAPQTATGTPAADTAISAATSGGWNIFAPGSGAATTGLSGLLNMFSGSSDSAFGNLINASFMNSIASSAFLNPGETIAPMIALAALLPAFSQMSQPEQPEVSGGVVGDSVGGVGGGVSGGSAEVGAALGDAPRVGGLSVPQGWSASTEAPLPTQVGSTPLRVTGGAGMGVPMGMPLGGKGKDGQQQPRYGTPVKIINAHPAGG